MKAMKTVIKAMTRTKETMVMVPMKMSSCLICSSEITCCCSDTASLLAIKELLRGPASMALERLLISDFRIPKANPGFLCCGQLSGSARTDLLCWWWQPRWAGRAGTGRLERR